MSDIDALRRALVKLEELWPILFDDLYFVCDRDRRHDEWYDEWHVTDHWFSIRTSLETRLATIEQALLQEHL